MLTVNLGPVPVPVTLLLLMVALLVAAWVGRLVGRGRQTGLIGRAPAFRRMLALIARVAPSQAAVLAAR